MAANRKAPNHEGITVDKSTRSSPASPSGFGPVSHKVIGKADCSEQRCGSRANTQIGQAARTCQADRTVPAGIRNLEIISRGEKCFQREEDNGKYRE